MNGISTHVLNLATGLPARGVSCLLEFQTAPRAWRLIAEGRTDEDGRIDHLLPKGVRLQAGSYRLTFDVAAYFRAQSIASFFSEVTVTIAVRDAGRHHHLPLLLGPFGYTTYRGS